MSTSQMTALHQPVPKDEPRHPLKEAQFIHLIFVYALSPYLQLMTVGKGWDTGWLISQQLTDQYSNYVTVDVLNLKYLWGFYTYRL